MKRYKQYEPFIVSDFKEDGILHPFHQHTYSSIIFIYNGEGTHFINNSQIDYESGDLFVIGPEDFHEFRTKTPTRFIYLKFTPDFFRSLKIATTQQPEIDSIIQLNQLKEFNIALNQEEKQASIHLIDSLLVYGKINNSIEFSYHILCCLIEIIKKAILNKNVTIDAPPQKENLITYIQQYIYIPEEIRIKRIAEQFHISSKYFGTWFNKNFGINYRTYIDTYRITLIKKRLQENKLTIKEITLEFKFADEAHFYKYFKNHVHITPKDYQKSF